MFPAHSSPACALQYISAQTSETFFCSPPQSVIPTSFPLLFASILTEMYPVYFRLSLPICLRLNDLHSFSPPAAQETARQMINATQTLPGPGTRYTVSLDSMGRHTKSHQPRLSYAAACKSGLKRGQRGAGHRTSMGNPAARAIVFPWDFTQLQLRNPFLPHRQVGPCCIPPQDCFALRVPEDCWCQPSPGMGLAQCCSMQDVSCLLRHLPSKLTYPAVMLRLHTPHPHSLTQLHWTVHKGLSKSCAENRIHTDLTTNAGPKHCLSARSRQDKTVQENSSNTLGGSSGSASLGHRHPQNYSFPSGRYCQQCADVA